MKARLPFRVELPPARLVREYARDGGADPRAYARALLEVGRRRLEVGTDGLDPLAHGTDLHRLAANALALFPVSWAEGTPGALTPEWLGELYRLSRPNADHKRHGRWYTARPIARYMARRALAAAGRRRPLDTVAALDPACGCGALAVPLLEEVVAFQMTRAPERSRMDIVAEAVGHFILADVDADALDVARFRLELAARRLAGGDAPLPRAPAVLKNVDTLTAVPAMLAPGGVDIVVMNPPYLGARYFEQLPDPRAARAALRRVFGWNDDLYAHGTGCGPAAPSAPSRRTPSSPSPPRPARGTPCGGTRCGRSRASPPRPSPPACIRASRWPCARSRSCSTM